MTSPTQALPLLLAGHGTRDAEGAERFRRFTGRVRRRLAGQVPLVDGGFIELSAPSLAAAAARMWEAAGGPDRAVTEMVAVPLVLTAAGHGKGDIPAALARERARHRGLAFRYGRPLGPHPVLQDLLATRVDEALAGAPRAGTHVVVIGRGSTDPDGNAEVAKVARLLWEGRGFGAVDYGFVSLAEPSVPAALERARLLGARRVVVAPYFLFPGVLPDRVAAQAREFGTGHAGLDVVTAGVLDDCDELAGLVAERYLEAVAGDIRMNCDTCAYRVPLPGFAGKVGQPQAPHHHPHDDADHLLAHAGAPEHHLEGPR